MFPTELLAYLDFLSHIADYPYFIPDNAGFFFIKFLMQKKFNTFLCKIGVTVQASADAGGRRQRRRHACGVLQPDVPAGRRRGAGRPGSAGNKLCQPSV